MASSHETCCVALVLAFSSQFAFSFDQPEGPASALLLPGDAAGCADMESDFFSFGRRLMYKFYIVAQ